MIVEEYTCMQLDCNLHEHKFESYQLHKFFKLLNKQNIICLLWSTLRRYSYSKNVNLSIMLESGKLC